MGTEQDLQRIAQLAGEVAARAARGSAVGLAPLLKEMQALGEILPGLAQQRGAEQIALEAEIEAGFDNLPV